MPGSRDLRRTRGSAMPATNDDPFLLLRRRARKQARARDHGSRRRCSPACSRISALQVLHLREKVTEMFTVLAALAMPGMRAICGTLKRRLGKYPVDTLDPCCLNFGQARRHTLIRHRPIQFILGEQLDRIGP